MALVDAAEDVLFLFESCDPHMDGPCPVCRLRAAIAALVDAGDAHGEGGK